jgi:hypothetical protein
MLRAALRKLPTTYIGRVTFSALLADRAIRRFSTRQNTRRAYFRRPSDRLRQLFSLSCMNSGAVSYPSPVVERPQLWEFELLAAASERLRDGLQRTKCYESWGGAERWDKCPSLNGGQIIEITRET